MSNDDGRMQNEDGDRALGCGYVRRFAVYQVCVGGHFFTNVVCMYAVSSAGMWFAHHQRKIVIVSLLPYCEQKLQIGSIDVIGEPTACCEPSRTILTTDSEFTYSVHAAMRCRHRRQSNYLKQRRTSMLFYDNTVYSVTKLNAYSFERRYRALRKITDLDVDVDR